MAETAEEQQEIHHPEPQEEVACTAGGDDGEKRKAQPPAQAFSPLTFNIWPPSQRTRDAVINRLVETLAKESILSKRYGAIPQEEAATLARQIEKEAFAAASSSAPSPADATATAAADDIEIGTLQIYSKEISTRMLSTVKARASAPASSPSATSTPEPAPPSAAEAPAASDEAPSLESESSYA